MNSDLYKLTNQIYKEIDATNIGGQVSSIWHPLNKMLCLA